MSICGRKPTRQIELRSLPFALGLAKNKLVILGVEAPGRQGVKSLEYLDIPRFCTGSRTGCISVQNGQLFLSEP
jgi:hypothetical protein